MRRLAKTLNALGNTADGVFAADHQQRIFYWNQGAQSILGYKADQALGRPCYEVIQGRDDAGVVRCHPNCRVRSALLQEHLPVNCDLLCKTKNGRETWLNFSTVCLSSSRQKRPIIVHVFRNIHQRKLVEQAAQDFLRVVGQAAHQPPPPLHDVGAAASAEHPLTRRELEIVSLFAQGLSAKEIAARLRLSPFTVRNHIQSVLSKLHVHSKAQAVAYVYQRALLAPPSPSD